MKAKLSETSEGFGDDEHTLWRLNNGDEIITINNIFGGSATECGWIGIDNKFLEVMYCDWDSLELFAIIDLKGKIIIKGLRSIEKYIETEQIFIVEITGRAIEGESIYFDLPYDEWKMAVIDRFGNFIIPPSYFHISFDEETQTFTGDNYNFLKDRYTVKGEHIKC